MDKFNIYKSIFGGNMNDIKKLIDMMKLEKDEENIIINYNITLNASESLSYDNFITLINNIKKLQYKEDVYEHMYKLSYTIKDRTQLNTIMRIANMKESIPYHKLADIKNKNKLSLYRAKCPHCMHINIINERTTYSICGYNDIMVGYDWEGCGRDWCVTCGKKLCKKWSEHNLFLEENRYHDGDCCMLYSKKTNTSYYLEYCMCFVNKND